MKKINAFLIFGIAAAVLSGGRAHAADNNVTAPAQVTPAQIPASNSPATNSNGTVNWPDGTLVRASDGMTVYRVHGNILEPFTSEAVFLANGDKFTDVKVVDPSLLSGWSIGHFVEIPDNTLLMAQNNPTVYLFQGGVLHGIPSMDVFAKFGFSTSKIIVVKDADLQAMNKGDILK